MKKLKMFALFAVAILALTFTVDAGNGRVVKRHPSYSLGGYNQLPIQWEYTSVAKGPLYLNVSWTAPSDPTSSVVIMRFSTQGENAQTMFDGYVVFDSNTTSFQDHISPSWQYWYAAFEVPAN